MKTFYFTLAKDIPTKGNWEDAPQQSIELKDWKTFVSFVRNIATSFDTIVRACESKGYNNNGSYINK